MAFTKVEKLRTGVGGITIPQATMGAYLADGKVHKSRQIVFRVTRALINQLGWVADEGKLYVSINEGSGNDKGFLQLVLDKEGRRTTLEADSNQGVAFNTTSDSYKHYVLNECPVAMHVVNHVVDGNALIIECPDWLRYNPLSESQPEPKPETKIVDMHPGRGRRRQRA